MSFSGPPREGELQRHTPAARKTSPKPAERRSTAPVSQVSSLALFGHFFSRRSTPPAKKKCICTSPSRALRWCVADPKTKAFARRCALTAGRAGTWADSPSQKETKTDQKPTVFRRAGDERSTSVVAGRPCVDCQRTAARRRRASWASPTQHLRRPPTKVGRSQ